MLEAYQTEGGKVASSMLDYGTEDQPCAPIDAFRGEWSVVHTKSRNEKALSADLERRGVEHYLPHVRLPRRYGGRTTYVDLPLFPGYLFLCGGSNAHDLAMRTNRVVRILRVMDQAKLATELRHVYHVTTSDVPVDLYPGIRRGRRCRVCSGSLRGLEGVVLRRRGICRVYVGVEILGQSAEVELDPCSLEVLG